MTEWAIETRGVVKRFPARRRSLPEVLRRKPRATAQVALDGVDLAVRRGELFGLLGPNGAGKTTLVKILATLLLPDSGTASVAQLDVARDEKAIRQRVGVVLGGDRGLYWRLSARENLWYFSQLYDMPKQLALERIELVLHEVGLTSRAEDRVENYSKGMKQRLHIARGLLTNPEILLLDEPTIGLDPHAARELRTLVRDLVDRHGRTVVLTTHYLYEADALSDRVAILHRGRVVALGTPDDLKARHAGAGAVVVKARGGADELDKRLSAIPGVARVLASASTREDERAFRLIGLAQDASLADVVAAVSAAGASLVALTREEPSLEDVFVALTGEGLEGAGTQPGGRP